MWNPRPSKPADMLMAHARQPQPQGLGSPHILASPPGVPAPIHAINYTPKTGEVHQPGAMAPVHELNYSLLPQGSVGDRPQGMGNGGEAGMGAGISPTSGGAPVAPGQERLTGRYAAPATMATGMNSPGTPPLRPSPYSTGPGPRSAPSGPAPAQFGSRASMHGTAQGWGGGAMGGGQEMGAGAQGDIDPTTGLPTDPTDIQSITDFVNSTGLLDNQDTSTGTDGGVSPAPAAPPASAPAPPTVPSGWSHPDTSQMQVGDIVWYTSPDGKTSRPLGMVSGIDPATAQRRVTQLSTPDQQAILAASGTPDPSKTTTPHYQNIRNPDTGKNELWLMKPDGSPDHVIGLSSSQPTVPKPTTPKAVTDPGQARKLGASNIVMVKQPDGSWKYDPTLSAQAAQDAASKGTSSTSSAAAAAAIRAASATDLSKLYTVTTAPDGSLIAVNLHDPTGPGGVAKLTPSDPSKGIYSTGSSLLKLSDDGKSADVLYTAPPNYAIATIGGDTFAYDPQDPTKRVPLGSDPTYLPTAAANIEQTKANTQSIMQQVLNGQITAEQARETLMESVHTLLHPKASLTSGGYLVPSGASLDINYGSVVGGPQRSSQHIDAGPIDADAQAIAKQVTDFFTDYDKRQAGLNANFNQRVAAQSDNAPSPFGKPAPTAPPPAPAPNTSGQPAQTATGQPTGQLLPAGQAGLAVAPPGSTVPPDPRFAGVTPPSNVTTAAGDVAHYDTGGALSGITYLNTAPPHYGEEGYPGSESYTEPGSTLDVGVSGGDTSGADDSGGTGDYGDIGNGQESFGGRGLMPRTGRGSTGIGWNPQQGAGHMSNYWQPKGYGTPGAGGESGMGAGGVYVQSPDGSMHWNETAIDPNPNGGSVVQAGTEHNAGGGTVVQGANRQSGPTGPGGTGPPGSQARAGHIAELAAAPTFRSGTSGTLGMMSGASPAQLAGASYAQATGGQGYTGYPGGTAGGMMSQTGANPWVAPPQVQPLNVVSKQVDPWNTPSLLTPKPTTVKTGQPTGQLPVTQPGIRSNDQIGLGGGNEYGAGQGINDPLYHSALSRRGQMGMGSGQGPLPAPGGAGPAPPGGPAGAQPGWVPPVPPQDVAGIGHRFGQQMDQGEPQHSGVDLQALEGTSTISPVDGIVEKVEHNPQGLGLTVVIRGKDGTEHRLGHLSDTHAYPGMLVAAGQDIAKVGSSGNTTGSHLHWGVRDGQGQPQDPTGALGPMSQMPPVPGTEMMGPPGGNGGQAQMGGPPPMPGGMGGGQEQGWSPRGYGAGQGGPAALPGQVNTQSPDYQQGYQDGMSASKSPGTPPVFVPALSQPIPSTADQQGQDQGGGMGGGQDSADTRWDLYEAKDTQGFWGPPGQPALGSGGEGGMGAGDVAGVSPDQQVAVDAQIQTATIAAQEAQHAADQQFQVSTAQVNANIAAENDRHSEALSQLQQNFAFHQDDVALQQQVNEENQRHNQATEALQAQATQMQQTLEQMKEANSIQLEQMQEGAQVLLQKGQQAFADWQSRQGDRMSILSSALNNPWLQQLTGMSPAPGVNGGTTGGQNLSNLIQQVLQPYDPSAPGGSSGGPAMFQGGAPQIQTPSWSQWQGWSPFQMAAYRTNVEALGPGVWNQVQQGLQSQFTGEGGSPNVTQMQAASATPEQSAGQQMTANAFGQTAPQWQANQTKMWSQSQAPKVQTNLAGIAA